MKVQCEFLAPPATKEYMRMTQMQGIFALLVQRVIRREEVRQKPDHPLIKPNYLKVVPFASMDGSVKYAVESSLKLAQDGQINVRHDVFETTLSGDDGVGGMRHEDTGDVIIDDLGVYKPAFVSLGLGYSLESWRHSNP